MKTYQKIISVISSFFLLLVFVNFVFGLTNLENSFSAMTVSQHLQQEIQGNTEMLLTCSDGREQEIIAEIAKLIKVVDNYNQQIVILTRSG